MELFKTEHTHNLLPEEGIVNYYGKVMNEATANNYLDILLNTIQGKNDEAIIFGRHIITKRKVAWYADDNYIYTYSNTTKQALPWTKELLELKKLAEELSGDNTTRACLTYTITAMKAWPGIATTRKC